MEAQNLSGQEQDGLADKVNESLGNSEESSAEESHHDGSEGEQESLPKGVQDRLWRQERKHQREMREMKSQLAGLHSQISQPNMEHSQGQMANPYDGGQASSGIDEQIHKAVSYALQHKEMEERRAKDEQNRQHIAKQYEGLDKHLNTTADKYEDFDDVVRGDTPFTAHMRDAALFLPKKGAGSAGEVLYKLGKNPSELERISKLHPVDQASEMVRLSHALIGSEEAKSSQPRPLGQIKSNPVSNTHMITDKTPVSELRARMKNNWK
jgi:rubrerythrin